MKPTAEIKDYIKAHAKEFYDLLLELAVIPAPSNFEEKRAEFVLNWLHANGAKDAYIDEVQNVILPIGCDGDRPIVVYMAHSDVVFPDTDALPLRVEDGKIFCPGVGDDTANAVALMAVMEYLANASLRAKEGVLLVINSGEEGLGNLRGSREIMRKFGSRVREFVTFDGYAESYADRAVGSMRYKITVRTEGGHSWSKFGNRNAIAAMSELVVKLYSAEVPAEGRTTFNVGGISGGTSVNTIAQSCELLYEFRSDTAANLRYMKAYFESVIAEFRATGLELEVELIGERPCGEDVDETAMKALCARSEAAILACCGLTPSARASSTDCNIPLSMGIPSVCVGAVRGGGAHTREEYVEIDSLVPGIATAFEMILDHFE